MSDIPQARPVHFETERYIVRSVVPDDAGENWQRWANDPEAARWLNMRAREVTRDELLQYVGTFDNRSRFLIGVFEKGDERFIGIHVVYIDWKIRGYMINAWIGEGEARHKGARSETRRPIHQYFMDQMNLEFCLCTVVEGHPQIPLMQSWGWAIEGRSEKPSASGGPPVGILHMRLTKDAWRRAEANTTAS
jgi:hypothetical protein